MIQSNKMSICLLREWASKYIFDPAYPRVFPVEVVQSFTQTRTDFINGSNLLKLLTFSPMTAIVGAAMAETFKWLKYVSTNIGRIYNRVFELQNFESYKNTETLFFYVYKTNSLPSEEMFEQREHHEMITNQNVNPNLWS